MNEPGEEAARDRADRERAESMPYHAKTAPEPVVRGPWRFEKRSGQRFGLLLTSARGSGTHEACQLPGNSFQRRMSSILCPSRKNSAFRSARSAARASD